LRRSLPFCAQALPYPFTGYPNLLGHRGPEESQNDPAFGAVLNMAMARCNPLTQPFVCAVLEPFCGAQGQLKPPCRNFCRSESTHNTSTVQQSVLNSPISKIHDIHLELEIFLIRHVITIL
jgi:hypothetical protein